MDMSVSSVPGVVLLVRDGDGGDDDGSGGNYGEDEMRWVIGREKGCERETGRG